MSLPAYPEYTDSGVEWLGPVPAHWQITPLKYLVGFASGGTPAKDAPEYWDGEIPWASAKDMKVEYLIDAVDHVTELAVEVGQVRVLPVGSVVVVVRGMILARAFPVAVTQCPLAINQDLKALLCSSNCHSDFLAWYLRGTADESLRRLDEAGHGTKALRMDAWTSISVVLPSLDEQSAIAAFLDRETSKIDALVAEQEKLIELLQEKRQAVISHAVTKGFGPDAAMKDSGIEWLGEVPAHWEIRKLSTVISKITNGYVGPTRDVLVESGVKYLQSLHIKNNTIHFNIPYFVSEEWSAVHEKSILKTGDVLVVQTGDIGQVAVVPEEYAGSNCHALIVITPISKFLRGDWLSWVLNSRYGFHTLRSIQTGALHPHLNCGNVKDVFIPVPKLDEQRSIVAHLTKTLSEYHQLVDEAQQAIVFLMERRTALISAAVTGKIDVRGLVAAETTEAA